MRERQGSPCEVHMYIKFRAGSHTTGDTKKRPSMWHDTSKPNQSRWRCPPRRVRLRAHYYNRITALLTTGTSTTASCKWYSTTSVRLAVGLLSCRLGQAQYQLYNSVVSYFSMRPLRTTMQARYCGACVAETSVPWLTSPSRS